MVTRKKLIENITDEQFGFSVDIDGNYVVVGAQTNYVTEETTGVHMYMKEMQVEIWSDEPIKLLPNDATEGHYFGRKRKYS